MTLLLLIAGTLVSYARDPGERPGPMPPRCDIAQVNVCIGSHKQMGDESRARSAAARQKIQSLNSELSPLEVGANRIEAKASALETEGALLELEISSLMRDQQAADTEILPNFLSLEKYFKLERLDQNWFDRYPEERKQKLSERLVEARTEGQSWNQELEKNQKDISRLHSEIRAFAASALAEDSEAAEHDRMCSNGCRNAICATGN